MMMALSLRQDLHYCIVGGRPIFLDGRSGRYSALPHHLEQAFLEFVRGTKPVLHGIPSLQPLIERGWLVSMDGGLLPLPVQATPPSGELAVGSVHPGFGLMAMAAYAQAYVSAHLIRRPFADIMRVIDRKRVKAAERERPYQINILQRLVGSLDCTSLLLGTADRCLVRSLALLILVYRQGIVPDLVVGVRTHPFKAHCWVQHQDLVLNDSCDHVRLFTPIMML